MLVTARANALNQYSSRQNSTTPFSGTQSFTYDADGNVLSDGHWLYEWDAENRLVAMQTDPAAIGIIALADARRLEFKYDYLNRRVEKLVRSGFTGTVYTTVLAQRRYLYDGWNLVAEYAVTSLSPLTLTLTRSYTWGLDIARTLADAGGVGALLQIVNHATGAAYHPTYDGKGNIASLIDGSTGSVAVAYEYSPFGETIRRDALDATIGDQPFRFSTKFTDDETGLVYYGRRYYEPTSGRFLGRDPKYEMGDRYARKEDYNALNLYALCGNNAINRWDYLGMYTRFGVYIDGIRRDDFFENGYGGDWDYGGSWDSGSSFIWWATPPGTRGPIPKNPPANPIVIKPWSQNQYKPGDSAESVAAAVNEMLNQLRTIKAADGSETRISQIIKAIESSQFSVDIYAAQHPDFSVHRTQARNPGTPAEPSQTGSIIYFAPDVVYRTAQGGGVNGEDIFTNPLTTLAHELTHAYKNLTAGDDGVFTFNDEFEAIRVENQLRSLMGLPIQMRTAGQLIPDYDKYVPRPPE
jgi:RHS repeat-associated protein